MPSFLPSVLRIMANFGSSARNSDLMWLSWVPLMYIQCIYIIYICVYLSTYSISKLVYVFYITYPQSYTVTYLKNRTQLISCFFASPDLARPEPWLICWACWSHKPQKNPGRSANIIKNHQTCDLAPQKYGWLKTPRKGEVKPQTWDNMMQPYNF